MDMDMSGIEPDPSRMLSERDNQLHHMPLSGNAGHSEDVNVQSLDARN